MALYYSVHICCPICCYIAAAWWASVRIEAILSTTTIRSRGENLTLKYQTHFFCVGRKRKRLNSWLPLPTPNQGYWKKETMTVRSVNNIIFLRKSESSNPLLIKFPNKKILRRLVKVRIIMMAKEFNLTVSKPLLRIDTHGDDFDPGLL